VGTVFLYATPFWNLRFNQKSAREWTFWFLQPVQAFQAGII